MAEELRLVRSMPAAVSIVRPSQKSIVLNMWMPCAAHAEMLTLLRREWDRARAGSAQARAAGGPAQPENLTSVRRVAREVLAQVTSLILL